jgi:ribosomal protein S12 methylthiotransferase accessory factor
MHPMRVPVQIERALLLAIFEVIERDAISLTWLQKLSLPRIEIDFVPPDLKTYWDRYLRSSREFKLMFFNATTDLGVPTVYGVQMSQPNTYLTTVVTCSTAMDPVRAIAKVMCDIAAVRVAFRNRRPIPEKWEDFTDIFHGGTYMGRPEQVHAFDFLLHSQERQQLSRMASLTSIGEKQDLQTVLTFLRRKNLDAFAVDLSTDEALRAGVRVVRVLIPALQPVGFQYLARYLGHARLYDAPGQMGYPVYDEEHLNHWPQPFA